jgi:hypothetical protein
VWEGWCNIDRGITFKNRVRSDEAKKEALPVEERLN